MPLTSKPPLNIPIIDVARDDAARLVDELRHRLSPRGDIVSETGRQRTVELFGEPLTPQQVVERICRDVERNGLKAVLDYTARLDGKQLTAQTLRVAPIELVAAHQQADPQFLATLRRIVGNVVAFQSSLLPLDALVQKDTPEGGHIELRQRYLPLKRIGICIPGGGRPRILPRS